MMESVVFTDDAKYDIRKSFRWYESREPGLGEEFLRCVEACIQAIQRHPELYPMALDDIRRARVRRFPFEVFYEVTGVSVIIYCVFHCSQNPQKWRRRFGWDD